MWEHTHTHKHTSSSHMHMLHKTALRKPILVLGKGECTMKQSNLLETTILIILQDISSVISQILSCIHTQYLSSGGYLSTICDADIKPWGISHHLSNYIVIYLSLKLGAVIVLYNIATSVPLQQNQEQISNKQSQYLLSPEDSLVPNQSYNVFFSPRQLMDCDNEMFCALNVSHFNFASGKFVHFRVHVKPTITHITGI